MDDRVFPFLVVRTPPGVHGQLRLAIENGDGDAEFEAARQFQVAYDCLPADSVIRDHMTWPLYFGLRLHDAEQDPPLSVAWINACLVRLCGYQYHYICQSSNDGGVLVRRWSSCLARRWSPRPTLLLAIEKRIVLRRRRIASHYMWHVTQRVTTHMECGIVRMSRPL